MKLNRLLPAIILLFAGILWFGEAAAVNIHTFRPNPGSSGTLRLMGTDPLPAGSMTIGFFANYPKDPLIFHNFTTGQSRQAIVEYMATQDLVAEIGVSRRFSIGVDVPGSLVRHIPAHGGLNFGNFYRVGDIALYGRYNLLHPEHDPLGLTLIPFFEFPSGQVDHFTGDRGVNFGLNLSVDKKIGRYYVVANVGYKNRRPETVTVLGSSSRLELDDEFTFGLGQSVDIIPDRLQILGEVTGSTVIKDFAKRNNSSPLEVNGALRAFFKDKAITLTVGGGAGIRKGYGSPTYRAMAGLSFNFPLMRSK